MKKVGMKAIISSILVLSICLASSSSAFAATVGSKKSQTQENYSFTVHADQEQLKLINSLKGKKMSRLEFFEKVFPDVVSKLSDNQKKRYASEPFEILAKKPTSGSDSVTAKAPSTGSSSESKPNFLIEDVVSDITIDEVNGAITYGGASQEVLPIPFVPLELVINLTLYDNHNDICDSAFTDDNDVDNTEVDGTYYTPVAGYKYWATGTYTFYDWTNVKSGVSAATSRTITAI